MDNYHAHVLPNYSCFFKYSQDTDLDSRLVLQPHNIPDLNLLDIVFFNSIQFLQHTRDPSNIYDIYKVFQERFW